MDICEKKWIFKFSSIFPSIQIFVTLRKILKNTSNNNICNSDWKFFTFTPLRPKTDEKYSLFWKSGYYQFSSQPTPIFTWTRIFVTFTKILKNTSNNSICNFDWKIFNFILSDQIYIFFGKYQLLNWKWILSTFQKKLILSNFFPKKLIFLKKVDNIHFFISKKSGYYPKKVDILERKIRNIQLF